LPTPIHLELITINLKFTIPLEGMPQMSFRFSAITELTSNLSNMSKALENPKNFKEI
tara:strand:+ start:123 stop:293 length:171 start_codon:yes stop_codon:yes gene_type:complete